MAMINRFGIKQPDGTYQYHEFGANAENISVGDKSLDTVLSDIKQEVELKYNASGGSIFGELVPEGGISYSGKNGYISFPEGGQFKTVTSSVGQLKIYLPSLWSNTFIKFKLSIANYETNSSVDYFISGYLDSAQQSWSQCSAVALGHYNETLANLPVGFGVSDSACVVTIGDIGTSWSFVSVAISDVIVNNFTGQEDYLQWARGWSILLNANRDISIKQTITKVHVAENIKELALDATESTLDTAKGYTDQKIAELIDNAPETLDTLKEIANELGNNQSAIDAINSLVATKADKTDLNAHSADITLHVSTTERDIWNAKQDALTIDETISSASINPVQNRAVYNALNSKVDKEIGKSLTSNDFSDLDKTKLDGIENGANLYVHPKSGVASGQYSKVTVNEYGHITAGSNPVLSIEEGGTGATTAENALQNLGIYATAQEINTLGGIKVSTDELNFIDGVTSNIQSQLDRKAGLETATTTSSGLLSFTDKAKIDTVEEGANNYSHPIHTSHETGLYNITVDGYGHVTAANAVTKDDIMNLGIPDQDTTYEDATQTESGLMSAADKIKLDKIDLEANKYVLPVASATLGGVRTTSTVSSVVGYSPTPIINGVPYYKDAVNSLDALGVTATASEINVLDGIEVTTEELNSLKNISTDIQSQIDSAKSYADEIKTELTTSIDGLEKQITELSKENDDFQIVVDDLKEVLDEVVYIDINHSDAPEGVLKVNADCLDWHTADYFATAEAVSDIINGATIVASAANAECANKDSNGNILVDTYATKTETTNYVNTAISNLINGAPTTLDTLKEIADAMVENDEVVAALNTAIGTKAESNDLTNHTGNTVVHINSSERTNWNDANSKKHTHTNKTILDGTTASYTAEEQAKLAGIAVGANAYTLPNATSSVLGGVKIGSNLSINSGIISLTKDNVIAALGYTPPTTDTNTWRPLGTTADTACAGNDSRLSNSRPASDVYAWAKASAKPTYTYTEVGAAAASHTHTKSQITDFPTSMTPTAHNQAASTITAGTFGGQVIAPVSTDYTTNHVRNGVFTTTDPGANVATSYANGSIIYVYE